MRFLPYNPDEVYLLPPSVKDVLGEDHLCFFVHRLVERLDLSAFEAGYVEEGWPAYAPALLVKVWLYAYALGLTSSRRLEQRIREDLGLRYLAGGATPDYWTLNAFRRRHEGALTHLERRWAEIPQRLEELKKAGVARRSGQSISAHAPRIHAGLHGSLGGECKPPDRGTAGDAGGLRQCLPAAVGGGGGAALPRAPRAGERG